MSKSRLRSKASKKGKKKKQTSKNKQSKKKVLKDDATEFLNFLEEYESRKRNENLKPSEEIKEYWYHANILPTSQWKRESEYQGHTQDGGKWLIFVDRKNIDEVWGKIKKATEDGVLGDSSKVSTSRPNPNGKSGL